MEWGKIPRCESPEAYLSLFGQIPDFDQKLATMRKYEISCSIILQALSQLKDIYKDKWNTIVANCDTKLFLGCDDSETIEWMLKMLGKKTTTVENTSYQANGSGSTSYNKSSLEVMTIDQITMMQDDECLVRIRGVRPYYGKKYELTDHPNYKYAASRKGKFYIPIAGNVTMRDKRPLWQRLADKMAAENEKPVVAGNPEASVQPHPVPAEVKKSVISEVKKPAPSSTAIKNEARKSAAKEATKEHKEFDGFAPVTEDMITKGLAEALGVDRPLDKTGIKETVETLISLMELPKGDLTYAATE